MIPKVSVTMSIHQENDSFLEQSLSSILVQSLRELEFILVDDGMSASNLDCLGRFNDPRITLIRNELNQGLTRSLNLGAKSATGKYIARLDSDDWSHGERLALQYGFVEDNPEYVLCGSRIQEDSDGALQDPECPSFMGMSL